MLRLDCAETAALPQFNTLQNRGAFQRLDSSTYFATSTGIILLPKSGLIVSQGCVVD